MYQQRFSFPAWVLLVGIPSMLLDNLEKCIYHFRDFFYILEKYMSQFGNIHTDVWSVTSIRFEKNTLQYGKYNLELGEIHNLGKYTVQFGEIHFAIWTNTFQLMYQERLQAWVLLVGIPSMLGLPKLTD